MSRRRLSRRRFEDNSAVVQRSVQIAHKFCRHVKKIWMNKQSHFEPKATLRASSAFDAKTSFSELDQWSEVPLLSPHFLRLHIS
jgi:hypothetical protein